MVALQNLSESQKTYLIGGLVPIPDNLSDEEAALLEPLSCCLNGFSHIGPIAKDNIK
jgi:threonine dehydrogenase-like Zn-dependent dehydrogenase